VYGAFSFLTRGGSLEVKSGGKEGVPSRFFRSLVRSGTGSARYFDGPSKRKKKEEKCVVSNVKPEKPGHNQYGRGEIIRPKK